MKKIYKPIIFFIATTTILYLLNKLISSSRFSQFGIPSIKQNTELQSDQISPTLSSLSNYNINPPNGTLFAKDFQISLQSSDLETSNQQIQSLLKDLNAKIISIQIFNQKDKQEGALLIHLPVENSDLFVSLLKDSGHQFLSEKIQNNDLAKKQKQLQEKINSLKENNQQLSSLLGKNTNIDFLKIQSEIIENQRIINESKEQLDSISVFINTAKFTITLTKPEKEIQSSLSTLKSAGKLLLKISKLVLNITIWILVLSSPIFFLLFLIFWLFKKITKK
ncbi:DUF4349 domain-containing protein [Patescibacteria group bacterium]|nr:DUF4349 domain-containing protein [Patescibacteria group bacterium]MCG2701924.1 DUF4349 domain-containing protein [Candidatus Parcubacteria bacterium]MBU4265181.1 DUF4349 domain-containing protein [Patescibacteria group bacterium]MBU4390745.1 DUF4349 domain-containing protein [Patescibacteria group bacterium]MBU4396972.1 DUF4349 domain-containing protein [Patescibacteria group bacterium]